MSNEQIVFKKNLISLESEIVELLTEFNSYNINLNEYLSVGISKFYDNDDCNLKERYEFLLRLKKALNIEITKYKVNIAIEGISKYLKSDLDKEKLNASINILIMAIKKMDMFDELDKDALDMYDEIAMVSYNFIKICMLRNVEIEEFFSVLINSPRMAKSLNNIIKRDIEIFSSNNFMSESLFNLKKLVFTAKSSVTSSCPFVNLDIIKEIVNISSDKDFRLSLISVLEDKLYALRFCNTELKDLLDQARYYYYLLDRYEKSKIGAQRKYRKDLNRRCDIARCELNNLRNRIKQYYECNNEKVLEELNGLFGLINVFEYIGFSESEESKFDFARKYVFATKELKNSVANI